MEAQLPKLKAEYPDDFAAGIIGRMGGEFLEAGMTDEGIALLEFNVESEPDSPGAHADMARAYLVHGDRQDARRYCDRHSLTGSSASEVGASYEDLDRNSLDPD